MNVKALHESAGLFYYGCGVYRLLYIYVAFHFYLTY